MTIYAKIRDGAVIQYPYDLYTLRQDNPNTSYWDMIPVTVEPKPEFDAVYKELESLGPTLVDGVWTQGWQILDRDADDITESVENKKREVRAQRTNLLEETDFYGFSDVTMTSEMSAYRQALRDVPSQEGFPNTVVWPTKP